MKDELQEILDGFRELEEIGQVEQALTLCGQFMEEVPQYRMEFLRERALLEFQNGYDREALVDFVQLDRNTDSKQYRSIIFEAYIEPNRELFEERYKKNQKLLIDYPYFFGNMEENNSIHIAWADESLIVYYSDTTQSFLICENAMMEIKDQIETVFFLHNMLYKNVILQYQKASVVSWRINDRTLPIYLSYDEEVFDVFMKTVEVDELLLLRRVVLLKGEKELRSFFDGDMVRIPDIIVAQNAVQQRYSDFFENAQTITDEQCKNYRRGICEYYETQGGSILERIKNGYPRILFLTTRFSTALQYHVFNSARAARTLGLEAQVYCEKDSISVLTAKGIFKEIYEYKPDILFLLDHFRFEYDNIYPSNLVFLTWIQDPLSNIMNPEACGRLTERDVIMNHIISYPELLKLYAGRRMIKAPIPANEEIYKPYLITDSDREKYSADICMVCHGADVEGSLDEWVNIFDEDMRTVIRGIFYEYVEGALQGIIFYSKREFLDYLTEKFKKYQFYERKVLDYIAENMYLWSNQCIFRQVIADWLIEAGFENIKLWGNGWLKSPKYTKYAMGPAQNGEVLSKICQSSKIVLGNNIMTTAAARAWETMLSGGFYMSNYIPPEYDICDIRHILLPDEFVMFYDKEDLLSKVHFYLKHEKERQVMIQKGRTAALERMTFRRMMSRVIKETAEILDEQMGRQ